MALGFLLKRGDFVRRFFFIHMWLIAKWKFAKVEFGTVVVLILKKIY